MLAVAGGLRRGARKHAECAFSASRCIASTWLRHSGVQQKSTVAFRRSMALSACVQAFSVAGITRGMCSAHEKQRDEDELGSAATTTTPTAAVWEGAPGEVGNVPLPQWAMLGNGVLMEGASYYTDCFGFSARLGDVVAACPPGATFSASPGPALAGMLFGTQLFKVEAVLLSMLGARSSAEALKSMAFDRGDRWRGFEVLQSRPEQVLLAAREEFSKGATRTWVGLQHASGQRVVPEEWRAASDPLSDAAAQHVQVLFGSALVRQSTLAKASQDPGESLSLEERMLMSIVGFHVWYSKALLSSMRSSVAAGGSR